jgi:hypothetical protein
MFCVPMLVSGGSEDVGSCFHALVSWTRFWRCGGRRVPFSCFALPNSLSAVPRTSSHVFMFLRFRGRHVPFSCFASPYSFSALPRASGPVFMFCALGLIFGGSEGVGSRFIVLRPLLDFNGTDGVRTRFHVMHSRTRFRQCGGCQVPFSFLRPRTCFRWYLGRRVPFSCFALSDSFSAVLRASGPVFMFCSPRLVFSDTHGIGSHFHVLRARTHFRRYRRRPLPFSCFALTDMFSAVRRASGPVFMFFAPGYVFGGTEGVGSRFHVLHSGTRFRRYRGCRVPFSCFALPNSFSTVQTASAPVFMFCAHEHVFSGTEGVASRIYVLRSRTPFWGFRGRRVQFSCFASLTRFWRYRRC